MAMPAKPRVLYLRLDFGWRVPPAGTAIYAQPPQHKLWRQMGLALVVATDHIMVFPANVQGCRMSSTVPCPESGYCRDQRLVRRSTAPKWFRQQTVRPQMQTYIASPSHTYVLSHGTRVKCLPAKNSASVNVSIRAGPRSRVCVGVPRRRRRTLRAPFQISAIPSQQIAGGGIVGNVHLRFRNALVRDMDLPAGSAQSSAVRHRVGKLVFSDHPVRGVCNASIKEKDFVSSLKR